MSPQIVLGIVIAALLACASVPAVLSLHARRSRGAGRLHGTPRSPRS